MEWFSYTVAVILLISSIISPIVTSLINNKHQSDMRNIEIYELAKRHSLENFISCASQGIEGFSIRNFEDYYNSKNNLYIYFSNVPAEIDNLPSFKGSEFQQQLNNIVIKLSAEIKKS